MNTHHRNRFAGLAVDGPAVEFAVDAPEAPSLAVVGALAVCLLSGLLKNFRSADETFSRDRDDMVVVSIVRKRLKIPDTPQTIQQSWQFMYFKFQSAL